MLAFFRSPAAAYLLLPLASACWAGNHVSARAIAGHAPPATVSFLRWVLVFLVVSVIGLPWIRADLPKLRAKAGVMVFLSLTGGAAFGALQFVALQYTTALNMGVVGSVSPAFIVAASYVLFRDGLGPLQLFGVAVSLIGVLAIITQLYPERLLDLTLNGGDLIIIVNMVFWAIYCACLRLRPAVHPLSFLFALGPMVRPLIGSSGARPGVSDRSPKKGTSILCPTRNRGFSVDAGLGVKIKRHSHSSLKSSFLNVGMKNWIASAASCARLSEDDTFK